MVHLVLIVSPYAGIVVGQQLQAYTYLIAAHLVGLTHGRVGLVQRSRQVLHVVANLVGNHVGVGKGVALNAQLTLHLGEERQVDIQLLVARAIEGTHGSRSRAAGRVHLIAEQHQRRILVLTPAVLLEHLRPDFFGRGQDLLAVGGQLLLLLGEVLFVHRLCRSLHLLLHHVLHNVTQVTTLHEGHQGNDNNTSKSASNTKLGTTTHSAAIFHV